MGRVDGMVAFITGAARGQGRSHAVALAREGADVVVVDIGDQSLRGDLSEPGTKADLEETVRLVEQAGGRALGIVADISLEEQISSAVDQAISTFGRIDILVANAAVVDKPTASWDITKENWDALLAINLTGTWLTCKYVAPHMKDRGRGSMILVSSIAGIRAQPYMSSYSVSKWGVRGLMLNLANELGEFGVRANSIHPGTVDSPMVDAMAKLMGSTRDEMLPGFSAGHILKSMPALEPKDISAGVVFLASDESRMVTGLELILDAGTTAKV